MKIVLLESFQKDLSQLDENKKNQIFEVILKMPIVLKNIHQHHGLGLRKIHPSGIFEARVGLDLRLVFGYEKDSIYLRRVGNHDEVKRYLKNL